MYKIFLIMRMIFFLLKEKLCYFYTIWGMAWLELLMKVVVSCDKLGVGAYIFWSRDCLIGLPIYFSSFMGYFLFDPLRMGNPLNWNILVSGGEESNSDIVSNVEWKRFFRINWILCSDAYEDVVLLDLEFMVFWA